MGDLGQALFIRSCHEDVIFTRKSHNCDGTAFVQGDSAGGSKLTEQTLRIFAVLKYLNCYGEILTDFKVSAYSEERKISSKETWCLKVYKF